MWDCVDEAWYSGFIRECYNHWPVHFYVGYLVNKSERNLVIGIIHINELIVIYINTISLEGRKVAISDH